MTPGELVTGLFWLAGIVALGRALGAGSPATLLFRGILGILVAALGVSAFPVAARPPLLRAVLATAACIALVRLARSRREGSAFGAPPLFPPFAAAATLAAGAARGVALAFAGPLDTIDYRSHFALRGALLAVSPSAPAALLDRFAAPWHGFYPPGISLLYGSLEVLGGPSDRLASFVPALAAILLSLAVGEALGALRVPPLPATLVAAALVLSGGLFAPTEVGHAELWLAAGLAFSGSALLRRSAGELALGIALLALTKNEGLLLGALLAVAGVALAEAGGRRRVIRLAAVALAPGIAWALLSGVAGFPRADTGSLVPESLELLSVRAAILLPLLRRAFVFSSCGPVWLAVPFLLFAGLRRGGERLRRTGAVLAATALAEAGALFFAWLTTPSNAVWLFWLTVERVLAPPTVLLLLGIAALAAPRHDDARNAGEVGADPGELEPAH